MKRIFVFIGFISAFVNTNITNAQVPTFQWASGIVGGYYMWGNSSSCDLSSNIYTTGYFAGTADFDPGSGVYQITSLGIPDGFVSKLDAQGNFQWAKQIGGINGNVISYSVATDYLGNCYFVGGFSGTIDFDPGPGNYTLTNVGFRDIFISKFDSSGNFIWAKYMDGGTDTISDDMANSIVVDSLGNIFVTGFFHGTVDFDPSIGVYNLSSTGWENIFVCKLDSAGDFGWAKRMGGNYDSQGNSIAIDLAGNIYSTGSFQGTVDFDPGLSIYNISSMGVYDIFISKLDVNGNFLWVKDIGGLGHDHGSSISSDNIGNIYTTGHFDGTADFDPDTGTYYVTPGLNNDIFILKLDSNGSFKWVRSISGNLAKFGYSISNDPIGNVYATGSFAGTADFDPGIDTFNLSSAGDLDAFLLILDSSGNFIWSGRMGSNGRDEGYDIQVNNTEKIFTTGNFQHTVDFDPGLGISNLTSGNLTGIFVQKLNQINVGEEEFNAFFKALLFPNPTHGNLTFQYEHSLITSIEIYNSIGTKVLTPILSSGNNQLQIILSELPEGIYLIKAVSDNKVLSEKIIKQ